MEIITIQVTSTGMEVKDGRVMGAKLKYQAPGLDIYLAGRVSIWRRPAVNHLAIEQALARHIPLISLTCYGWL